MQRRHYSVFVYGTLRQGEYNHHWLRGSRFLGHWSTPPRYRLHDLGPYPVLCDGGVQSVQGEIYRVSPRTMAALDRLEGFPDHYDRKLITTPHGPAWIYFRSEPPAGARLIPTGDWKRKERSGARGQRPVHSAPDH